jgi:hypothetical protein
MAFALSNLVVLVHSPYCEANKLREHLIKNNINNALRPNPLGEGNYRITLRQGTMAQIEKIKNIVKTRCAITPGGLKGEVESLRVHSPYCNANRIREYLLVNQINNAKVQALGSDEYHIILNRGNKAQVERIGNIVKIHCLHP